MTDQESPNNRRVGRQLAAVILAGGSAYLLSFAIARILGELRPPLGGARALRLATMAAGGNLPAPLGVPDGPVQATERSQAAAWLAMYLLAAAARLAEVPDGAADLESAALEAEARYFELHLRAEARRMRAAAMLDTAATLIGGRAPETEGLLSWRAVMDGRTTPECRWANGRNFRADSIPEIGLPGAVHMDCRCAAGPPIPGAPIMPSL